MSLAPRKCYPGSGLRLLAAGLWSLVAFAQSGYVDARQCATCHKQIADDYSKTGMGRSFYKLTPAKVAEDFTRRNQFTHQLSGTTFSMVARGGEYFQRRSQVGFGGKETNVEESRIDYVMGSGNHARSYLHRTPAGTLIELPLGWYPGPGPTGSWGMAPGSDTDHPRTRRFISYKCMFCHNGIPQIPKANELPDSDPVFTGELPEGIDCQRCHGPGAAHIQAVSTPGARPASIRESIVNPARLSPERAMEVCMQCHLETSSTRIPATVVRFDRGPFSYKPGEPLADFMLSFDHAPGTGHDEKFETVSSVYRMRKSRCFTESAGKMTCQTCHDPHRVPRGATAAAHYAKVCNQCHNVRQGEIPALATLVRSGKHPAGQDCVACHMPKRRAEDIPELTMTEHRILARPPSGNLLAKLPQPSTDHYRGEVVPYYPLPFPPTGENALYLAVAQVGLQNNVDAGLPQLAREVAEQKPRNPEFYVLLGDAWEGVGKHAEAVRAYEQALQLQPDSVRALRSLATALQESGKGAAAAAALEKALKLAPVDPEAWFRYGILDVAAGRAGAGVEKIRKAISLDPSLPEKSRRLAEVLLVTGDLNGAMAALTVALKTDPYDEDAWDLAGRVLSQQGQTEEAMFHFERAVKLRPDSAPHLFDYGLALARAGRFDEAQARGEAAVKVQPGFADAHELLGGIFEQKRQIPQAVAAYRRTLELRPEASRPHLRLGVVLAAQGDRTGAEEHLREAAKARDAAVARQAAALLQQLKP